MKNPQRQAFSRYLRPHALLLGMTVVQFAAAASEQPAGPAPVTDTVATAMSGQQVYNNVCIACHSPPGIGGAPALGDATAWTPRIAQGMDTLIEHALNGFSGNTGVMPKKGERLDLSDEEVIRAVEYMVGQVDR